MKGSYFVGDASEQGDIQKRQFRKDGVRRVRLFYRKKVKTLDFSETIAACDLKVG